VVLLPLLLLLLPQQLLLHLCLCAESHAHGAQGCCCCCCSRGAVLMRGRGGGGHLCAGVRGCEGGSGCGHGEVGGCALQPCKPRAVWQPPVAQLDLPACLPACHRLAACGRLGRV